MERRRLVKRGCESDFVQAVKQILDGDAALSATVPLSEDAVQVGPRCVLAPQGPSDVHNLFLVDHFVKCQGLVCRRLLPAPDLSLEFLGRANCNALGQTASLVWVGDEVTLASFIGHLRRRRSVVSSENLVCPLGVLQLLSLPICHEHRCLRLLSLSVIEIKSRLVLRVEGLGFLHFETMFVHSASVCEFHSRVVPVNRGQVALRPEVDVR